MREGGIWVCLSFGVVVGGGMVVYVECFGCGINVLELKCLCLLVLYFCNVKWICGGMVVMWRGVFYV